MSDYADPITIAVPDSWAIPEGAALFHRTQPVGLGHTCPGWRWNGYVSITENGTTGNVAKGTRPVRWVKHSNAKGGAPSKVAEKGTPEQTRLRAWLNQQPADRYIAW